MDIMESIPITETHLFLHWLSQEDERLHRVFQNCLSIETYDGGASLAIHLLNEHGNYTEQDEEQVNECWLQYAARFDKRINQQSLQDLSQWTLEKIFNRYNGRLVRFTLADGSTFFGRFQTLNYSPSTVPPHFPGHTKSIGLEKLPNFHQDHNERSECRQLLTAHPGDIRQVIPLTIVDNIQPDYGQ
jgi:hypothetical protein